MMHLQTRRAGDAIREGTALPLIEWSEGEPFAVRVKFQVGLACRVKPKRIHHAELVAGIPGGSLAGRITGL